MPSRTNIEVAGLDLSFHAVPIDDETPSGEQIARAAGFTADDHAYVLQLRHDDALGPPRAPTARNNAPFTQVTSDPSSLPGPRKPFR